MNVAGLLQRAAQARPEQTALAQGTRELTYRELEERVRRLAGHLAACGLGRGDRVGLMTRNRPELLETLLAAMHAGGCIVPVNARSAPREAGEILADADVSAIVYDAEFAEHVALRHGDREVIRLVIGDGNGADEATPYETAVAAGTPFGAPADVAPGDLAWLFYTSGTTGHPKGVMLSHGNLLAVTMAYRGDLRRVRADHVVLHAAPLTHGSGLYALPALAGAATQIITASRSYDPEEITRTVALRGVTDIAFLAPTMVKWLIDHQREAPVAMGTLENIVFGGAPMYVEDLREALDALGPVLTQIYGQAEAPVTISRIPRESYASAPDDRLLASAGRAYTGVEIAVLGDDGAIHEHGHGEVLTRSPVVMGGYWRNPEATAQALAGGWLHTGDVGELSPLGLLRIMDRNKDMIISGGSNVYPREIEELLLRHPEVDRVAVIGAPDATWGERVVAVAIARDGTDVQALEAELDGLCRRELSDYKRPRAYEWREQLPTSSYGKVLKRELRESFWASEARSI